MSQSDYIKFKNASFQLKRQDLLAPVLSSNDYQSFKTYQLANTIINTKLRYNQMTPANKIKIFEIEKTITNCPTFILCKNTNTRTNRVITSGLQCRPSRPINIKQDISKTTLCMC